MATVLTFERIDEWRSFVEPFTLQDQSNIVLRFSGGWQRDEEAEQVMDLFMDKIIMQQGKIKLALLGGKSASLLQEYNPAIVERDDWWIDEVEEEIMTASEYKSLLYISEKVIDAKKNLDSLKIEGCRVPLVATATLDRCQCQPWPLALLEEDDVEEDE